MVASKRKASISEGRIMRIERDKPILEGWAGVISDEITDEKDPVLQKVIEELGLGTTDDLIVNVANGRSFIYRRAG